MFWADLTPFSPQVSGVCDCAAQCAAHPTATAFQFNCA
jgi:hypothetical protein